MWGYVNTKTGSYGAHEAQIFEHTYSMTVLGVLSDSDVLISNRIDTNPVWLEQYVILRGNVTGKRELSCY